MKNLALIQLKIVSSEQYVFQRRDNNAHTSPGLLACFGGKIEQGEEPFDAAVRELGEETSIDVGTISLNPVVKLHFPIDNNPEVLELHLFSAEIRHADFLVFEGLRHEEYTPRELFNRSDLSPTLSFLIDRNFF